MGPFRKIWDSRDYLLTKDGKDSNNNHTKIADHQSTLEDNSKENLIKEVSQNLANGKILDHHGEEIGVKNRNGHCRIGGNNYQIEISKDGLCNKGGINKDPVSRLP